MVVAKLLTQVCKTSCGNMHVITTRGNRADMSPPTILDDVSSERIVATFMFSQVASDIDQFAIEAKAIQAGTSGDIWRWDVEVVYFFRPDFPIEKPDTSTWLRIDRYLLDQS